MRPNPKKDPSARRSAMNSRTYMPKAIRHQWPSGTNKQATKPGYIKP